MKEEDIKKNKKALTEEATKRIKTGLFLSAFGEEKNLKISNDEINRELSKQMGMMPGQEKIIQDYYQKNPAALDSLRGQIYEEKIINEIKKNAKSTNKSISKLEAEKILKEENERNLKKQSKFLVKSEESKDTGKKGQDIKEKKLSSKKASDTKTNEKSSEKKKKKTKKVSKK